VASRHGIDFSVDAAHKLKSYHIRWSEKEDRAMIYALAGKAIKTEQAEILAPRRKSHLQNAIVGIT